MKHEKVSREEIDPSRIQSQCCGMQGWQPMETAPKDGTEVLVFSKYEDIVIAKWAEWGGRDGGWIVGMEYAVSSPTHWMSLPEPPKE